MRHATILVAILAFTPLASATAQVPVRPGERVRVTHQPICPAGTICLGPSPRQRSVGTFLAWKADTLVVQSNGDTLALPLDSVTRLDVSRARGLSSNGAAIGALVGGGLGVAAELGPVGIAFGAGVGALLGTGSRARNGAGIGLLIGAATGAVIGFASGDDPSCSGWFCWRFTAEEKAALGAIGLGGLGAVIGLIAGAASSSERWPVLILFASTVTGCTDSSPLGPADTRPPLPPLSDAIPYAALGSGKIAFSRVGPYPGEYAGSYVVDIDNRRSEAFNPVDVQPVTGVWELGRFIVFMGPSLSPNGTQIAFRGGSYVFVTNTDGTPGGDAFGL